MKKDNKKNETQKKPAEAVPIQKAKFKKGFLTINIKFAAFIGSLLFVLLLIVTLIVHNQLSQDLAQEVAERGATIARNLAAPTQEAMVGNDDLTLNILSKGVVEAQRPPQDELGVGPNFGGFETRQGCRVRQK